MSNVVRLDTKALECAAEYMANGHVVEAEAIYTNHRDNSDALSALSAIALSSGKLKESDKLMKEAIKLEPHNAAHYFSLGTILKTAGKNCIKWFKKAYKIESSLEHASALASELVEDDKHEQAVKILEKLVAEHPQEIVIRMQLASAYIGCSELDKANAIHEALIRQYPSFVAAYIALANHKKHDKDTICKPEKLVAFTEKLSTKKEYDQALFNAAGKVYEDLGEYDKAFDCYQKSIAENKLARPNNKYAWKQVEDVKAYYTPEKFDLVGATDTLCPLVFIFGMPRSGTTLTEQTLICHPDIETVGETPNIQQEVIDIVANGGSKSAKEATAKYIKNRIGKIKSRFVIDKMPGNYQYIGLMYQLFPTAKFICVDRDALDNLFSCYTTNFAKGHNWSYNFEDLAEERKRYEAYMAHWDEVLPNVVHTVKYEDMVADHKGETTKMLEYLGLEWVDKCSQFHKVKRNVKTASLAQVVQPLYSSSVSRAERFPAFIEGMQEWL